MNRNPLDKTELICVTFLGKPDGENHSEGLGLHARIILQRDLFQTP
jgi:hypothetical protein